MALKRVVSQAVPSGGLPALEAVSAALAGFRQKAHRVGERNYQMKCFIAQGHDALTARPQGCKKGERASKSYHSIGERGPG